MLSGLPHAGKRPYLLKAAKEYNNMGRREGDANFDILRVETCQFYFKIT